MLLSACVAFNGNERLTIMYCNLANVAHGDREIKLSESWCSRRLKSKQSQLLSDKMHCQFIDRLLGLYDARYAHLLVAHSSNLFQSVGP